MESVFFLSSKERRQIISNCCRFIRDLKPNDFINKLFECGVISYRRKQEYDVMNVQYKINEKLFMEVFVCSSRDQIRLIKQALHQTKQSELSYLLP